MIDAKTALLLESAMISCRCELEAMKAENVMRSMQGLSPAYGENEFLGLIDKHGIGHNTILAMLRDN